MKLEDLRHEIIRGYMEKFRKFDTSYNINSDGKVDVKCSIWIDVRYFTGTELPFKFGKIEGNFDVDYTNLKTMKNFPDEITNHFYCRSTNITSLEHFPKKVRKIWMWNNSQKFTRSEIIETGVEYTIIDTNKNSSN